MIVYNLLKTYTFFIKKMSLFVFKRANKQKKNLILPLNYIKVKYKRFQNQYRYTYIMPFRLLNSLILAITIASFTACTSNENILSLGEETINDNHNAQYTEDFEIQSKTLLAEYVITNNSGVALCGSYKDDYIGRITTNTVFKISPNIQSTDSWYNNDFRLYAELDSIVVFLHTNGYIYGDSTKEMTLALHPLTKNYNNENDDLTNYTTTPFDSTAWTTKTFRPEDLRGDTLAIKIPTAIAQAWFDSIQAASDHFIIDGNRNEQYDNGEFTQNDNDEEFINNVLSGLTIRSVGDNDAIIGFNMPKSGTIDFTNMSTVRMYYTSQSPLQHNYVDFKIYDPSLQYNQITADFSQGLLAGITPGGAGISSTQTNGITFVQSGLGLMTKIEIPSLRRLYPLGNNVTILDLDLNFSSVPNSYSDFHPLPTALYIDRLMNNGEFDRDGVVDLNGLRSSITITERSNFKTSFSAGITRYGIDEQLLVNDYSQNHTSLIISPISNHTTNATVNRLLIGDVDHDKSPLGAVMYYTTFE